MIDNILEKIDKMTIYSKDYDIILSLLDNIDTRLFYTIVESVLEGDISWTDFESFLRNTNYNNLLESSLESQEKLKDEYYKILRLREAIYGNLVTKNRLFKDGIYGLSNLGLRFSSNESQIVKDIYKKEFNDIQDNFIYDLLQISPDDNDLEIVCKIKLLDYILSKEIYKDTNDVPELDNLFFYTGEYIVPVSEGHQILTTTDRNFMLENNMTEDEMKKFKATEYLLRTSSYSVTTDNSEEV